MTHEIKMTFTEQELVILAGLVDIALKHEGARIARDAVIIIDKFEKAHDDFNILKMREQEDQDYDRQLLAEMEDIAAATKFKKALAKTPLWEQEKIDARDAAKNNIDQAAKSSAVNTTSSVNEPEPDLRANTGFEWSNDESVPRTREWDVPRKRPDPTKLDDEFLVGKNIKR